MKKAAKKKDIKAINKAVGNAKKAGFKLVSLKVK